MFYHELSFGIKFDSKIGDRKTSKKIYPFCGGFFLIQCQIFFFFNSNQIQFQFKSKPISNQVKANFNSSQSQF